MAYCAVLAVALCVFMMLVAISVMDGFLNKVEQAAKGLSGDIIVESTSLAGLGRYDEFIADVKKNVPEVQGASPFILTYAILRLPGTDYRQTVQVAGIRMPERNQVTDFAEGLHFQKGLPDPPKYPNPPDFDPPFEYLRLTVAKDMADVLRVYARDLPGKFPPEGEKAKWSRSVDSAALDRGRKLAESIAPLAGRLGLGRDESALMMAKLAMMDDVVRQRDKDMGVVRPDDMPKFARDLGRRAASDETFPQAAIELAVRFRNLTGEMYLSSREPFNGLAYVIEAHKAGEEILRRAAPFQQEMRQVQKQIKEEEARSGGQDTPALTALRKRGDELVTAAGFRMASDRVILGQSIPGISYRTDHGEIMRRIVPGRKFTLTLLPLGKGGSLDMDITPNTWPLSVIDDSKTDISQVDSGYVYVPFDKLQQLNDMGEETASDGTRFPARCSAVHLKVRPGYEDEAALAAVRGKVQQRWDEFFASHPDALGGGSDISIKTWRERQVMIISSVSAQRTLVVIMLGIISTVAIVLIFVLFYTIVLQKTKDVGVIKALGGSSFGVAQIFLGYGAAVGLVGSIIGTVGGSIFVHYINPIHDWVGRTTGLKIWNREWFIFDKIPNQVEPLTAVVIVIAAVVAGIIGALLPSMLAARMQPVEALRYE